MRKLFHVLTATLLMAGSAAMAAPPTKVVDGILVGTDGMTLYTFDRDTAGNGKSVCNGGCATAWPPLMAVDTDTPTGDYTLVVRDDGKKQWAYKGKPLYYFNQDTKAGDKTGDNYNKVWQLVRP